MTNKQKITVGKTFKSEFLENYILVLVGALIKKDTDALVKVSHFESSRDWLLKDDF